MKGDYRDTGGGLIKSAPPGIPPTVSVEKIVLPSSKIPQFIHILIFL